MGSHPQFCNREERKQQNSPRVETIMSLKTARSATANGGFYGSSCVGKFVLCRKESSWKVSHRSSATRAQPWREGSTGNSGQLPQFPWSASAGYLQASDTMMSPFCCHLSFYLKASPKGRLYLGLSLLRTPNGFLKGLPSPVSFR